MRDSILQSAIEYADLGFDAIPLAPNSKKPVCENWQTRAPSEMWERAPRDANIGLRCGGDARLCVFDADDDAMPGTSQSIAARLASFGIYAGAYPSIATPSGGRHFYLRLDGDLPGHARHYRADFGRGEFRYGKGAYVGAPPSIIASNAYRIIAGDLRTLPRIDIADVLPILSNRDTTNATPAKREHNAALLTPTIPAKTLPLLTGETIANYPSRSHAEAAIVLMLVDAGYDFDAILSLFLKYPCAGKFKERDAQDPDKAIRQYLYPTFLSAQRIAQVKQTARIAMQWAISHAWRGKTGAIDRAVFIAHCELAEHAGRIEYHASSRDLAERAHVGHRTATRATHRLKQAGLVQLVKPSIKGEGLANWYQLTRCIMSPLSNPVENGSVCNAEKHDAFWARGLGKSAGQIFEILRRESLTIPELAERTGRTRQTVWRNLKKMARIADPRTGEIIAIVHRDGNKWRARNDVDLDYIARCVGTHGKAERQRAQHARERKDFRARVKFQPKGNEPRCAS